MLRLDPFTTNSSLVILQPLKDFTAVIFTVPEPLGPETGMENVAVPEFPDSSMDPVTIHPSWIGVPRAC